MAPWRVPVSTNARKRASRCICEFARRLHHTAGRGLLGRRAGHLSWRALPGPLAEEIAARAAGPLLPAPLPFPRGLCADVDDVLRRPPRGRPRRLQLAVGGR